MDALALNKLTETASTEYPDVGLEYMEATHSSADTVGGARAGSGLVRSSRTRRGTLLIQEGIPKLNKMQDIKHRLQSKPSAIKVGRRDAEKREDRKSHGCSGNKLTERGLPQAAACCGVRKLSSASPRSITLPCSSFGKDTYRKPGGRESRPCHRIIRSELDLHETVW